MYEGQISGSADDFRVPLGIASVQRGKGDDRPILGIWFLHRLISLHGRLQCRDGYQERHEAAVETEGENHSQSCDVHIQHTMKLNVNYHTAQFISQ